MLKGNLSSFSLGEIFQSLSVNNHTGTLMITTKAGAQKCIYFSHGEISLFSSGSPEALRIGEILIRQGKLTAPDLKSALEDQKATGELLGKILIRKGCIGKDDLRLALEKKIREEIYDLFLLVDAEFEFHIDHLPDEVFDPLLKQSRIAINTGSVVLEGIRRVDEWRLIQKRLKTCDEIFIPVDAPGSIAQDPRVADLLGKLDGKTPVHRVFEIHGGSRFECAKTLYEFLESGQIRPITVEEAIQGGGRALESGELEEALAFLKFADQQDPARVEVLLPLAACLDKLEKPKEALQAKIRALKIYSDTGMHSQVMVLGREILAPGATVGSEVAQTVFRSALSLEEREEIRSSGELTVKLSVEEKDFSRAEKILEDLWARGFKDLNLRIQLSEQLGREGERDRAVSHLEAVVEELKSTKKLKDQIRILRLLFDIDPRRQDVKVRIQNLLAKQERLEKRKKRRVTIVGVMAIIFILISMIPLLYELKARELYCHAQRLEEISFSSNDFSKAKDAYDQLLKLYFFSSYSRPSQNALERISAHERVKRETQEKEKANQEKAQDQKLSMLRENYPGLLGEAKRLEEGGKIQEAHALYNRIITEFPEIPGSKNILFPILVTSLPKGAQVEVDGMVQGTTPIILRAPRNRELNLTVSRNGCQPTQAMVLSGQRWQIHFELNRRPIDEFKLSGPLQQSFLESGEMLFFPSRDGFLYSVDPGKKEVTWQRKVGQFGDLVSDLGAAPEGLLLGTVTGDVFWIFRENGKARWRARLSGPILAPPVLSPEGVWVGAASSRGEVGIFESLTGAQKGSFRAEDEVVAAPLFLGESLMVGSADHYLYVLGVPGCVLKRSVEFPGPISAGLIYHDKKVILATFPGTLHAYSPEEGKILWSLPLEAEIMGHPRIERDRLYAGTSEGHVVAVDLSKGAVVWRLQISKGKAGRLLVTGTHLFCGSETGDLVSVNLGTGAKEWAYKADSPILAPPLKLGDILFVPCATGKVLVMELTE